MDQYRKLRCKCHNLFAPVGDQAGGADNECRHFRLELGEEQKGDDLDRLPEPHFVSGE